MKIIFSITMLFFLQNVSSEEIVIKKFAQPKVGFGVSSNCTKGDFLQFCVNGPLVDSAGKPVGGYIDNGRTIQEWVNPDTLSGNFSFKNGVFGLDVQGVCHHVPYAERHALPKMQWAVQNGPMLVHDSQNLHDEKKTSSFIRSGIGCTHDQKLLIIISFEELSLFEFAELFIQNNCKHAMYLDGGPYVGYSNKLGSLGLQADAIKLQFFGN